jgi:hypothetical protein
VRTLALGILALGCFDAQDYIDRFPGILINTIGVNDAPLVLLHTVT